MRVRCIGRRDLAFDGCCCCFLWEKFADFAGNTAADCDSIPCLFLFQKKRKAAAVITAAVPLAVFLLVSSGYLCWRIFSRNAEYQVPGSEKYQIFGERRVMVIVPHQDDELNILGGVMEEYVRHGSDVFVVFLTNGDYFGLAQLRYQESLSVLDSIGIPADHVIFLGYGDNWKENEPHIYNAQPGIVMESYLGRTETYGTSIHPVYREGREYTIDNLTEDLKCVILEYSPNVIFCSDYDRHIDHKATSLLFDKVMGSILKENPGYTPAVYKAYAYGTAWEAEPDFYSANILSTQNHFGEPYNQKPAVYRWEDRVRFPVDGTGLSRSLPATKSYGHLSLYESQDAKWRAASVINSDKVAWQRFTSSLCLHAMITASSGSAELLNDFMLIDNNDLRGGSHLPYDGVWIPEQNDLEKTVIVTFAERSDVMEVVLYDHPSMENNILNAVIVFDDGTEVKSGPLDPSGAATYISVDKRNVSSFTVSIMESTGESAGLSEIEAFAETRQKDGCYIKLMDKAGNFLYDCQTESDGTMMLSVYLHGDLPEWTEDNYTVSVTEGAGTAVWEDGLIYITCPAGESFVLSVSCNDTEISDSILIRNPGRVVRMWNTLWQTMEKEIFLRCSRLMHKRLLVLRILEKAESILKAQM